MMRAINKLSAFALIAAASIAQTSARREGLEAFKDGHYSVALVKFREVLSQSPDQTSRVFAALTEAALGDCRSALPVLTAQPEPSDPVLYRMATLAAVKCYDAKRDEASTFSLLQRLRQRFPDDPDVLYMSAKLHMKAFNDATFAMFQRAPSSYRVHELSAEIFEVENRYEQAVAEYRKAIELNPNAPEIHYRLGRALLLQSHDPASLDLAATEFRSELKLSPEDGACEFQLGQIAQVEGKLSDAKLHFERAVTLAPNFVAGLIALGKLKTENKEYGTAIQLLSRAAAIQPQNETAHYALLTAYRNAGDMDKAKGEKAILDRLQKPPEGEFANFLKKLGEKSPEQ
ncbi:MAG: tetratricopeptide repeat protein [Bryobacteraceae bacterium]